jgi:pimeloyl-ACP methyl ester carboxylesterase
MTERTRVAGEARAVDEPRILELVTADGARISAACFGGVAEDAAPILLVHGWAADAEALYPHARRLSRRFPVIVPHLRMHGASLNTDTAGARPVTIPLIVDDLLAVLDALHVRRAVAAGHSMGGLIVTILADEHPGRISATVVADPAYGASPDEIDSAPERRAVAVADAGERYRERGRAPELGASYLAALTQLYDSEYLRDHSRGAAADTTPMLARRRHPTLALYSTLGAARTEEDLSRGADVRADVIVWPGTSHFAAVEHPAEFCWTLERWLDSRNLGELRA